MKIVSTDICEIWWDQKVELPNGVVHNTPDIILWDKIDKKNATLLKSVFQKNINKKIKEKYDNYFPLITELQRIYRNYIYQITPIIVGALEFIPKQQTVLTY